MIKKIFYSMDEGGGGSTATVADSSASTTASTPTPAPAPTPAAAPATSAKTVTAEAPKTAAKTTSSKSVAKAPTTGTPAKQEFDVSAWDGSIDTLPESSREYARLAVDRTTAALQAQIDEARSSGEGSSQALKELQSELEIYKTISEGLEDPRVASLTERLNEIEASSKSWQEKHAAIESQLKAYQAAEDQKWVNEFKEKHADMLNDKAKSAQFFGLCDQGWEEEAAAQLVAGTPELLKEAESIVNQLRLGMDGHAFAVQHARMKLGIAVAPRTPRVAATITNGAQGNAKTASRVGGGSVRDLPKDQARHEAASLALKLVKK